MVQSPAISIIIPLYNAEKYIDRCMKSIYAQAYTDYEIILVNDGSTDNSAAICKAYADKDERITYIEKENGGAGSARNMGIEAAKGRYLAFPDVDDWFEPEMYEELYKIADGGDFDEVFSGVNYYGKANGNITYSRTAECKKTEFSSASECRNNIMTFFPTSVIFDSPCNKLYKRSIVVEKNVRFSDTRRCQDAMFNLDFYNVINSVASTDKAYYNYIENTDEDIQRKFPINYIDINFAYFEKLFSYLKQWGLYNGKIKEHYDTSFAIAVYGTIGMFENPRWNLSKQEQEKYVKEIMARNELQSFLADATIRNDEKKHAEILRAQNYSAFMREYNINKAKDKIRNKEWIIKPYRAIKKTFGK